MKEKKVGNWMKGVLGIVAIGFVGIVAMGANAIATGYSMPEPVLTVHMNRVVLLADNGLTVTHRYRFNVGDAVMLPNSLHVDIETPKGMTEESRNILAEPIILNKVKELRMDRSGWDRTDLILDWRGN